MSTLFISREEEAQAENTLETLTYVLKMLQICDMHQYSAIMLEALSLFNEYAEYVRDRRNKHGY